MIAEIEALKRTVGDRRKEVANSQTQVGKPPGDPSKVHPAANIRTTRLLLHGRKKTVWQRGGQLGQRMLQPEDVAATVALVCSLPLRIPELVVVPLSQSFV